MDDYGIAAAVRGCFRSVTAAMRATGRTTRMIERYQEGDRIIFATKVEADRVCYVARDLHDKEIDYSVCDPKHPEKVIEGPRGTPKGRVIFDHAWLEQFYDHRIAQMGDEVRHLQDQASGYGQPHRETREAAKMISKFHF